MGAPRWDERRGRWVVEHRWSAGGKVHRRTRVFPAKGEATRYAKEMDRTVSTAQTLDAVGLYVPEAPASSDPPTLRAFASVFRVWLVSSRAAPATRQTYASYLRSILLPVLGSLRIDRITPGVVEALRVEIEAREMSAQGPLACLSSLMSHAVREGIVPANPCHTHRQPYRADRESTARPGPRSHTDAERRALLAAMPRRNPPLPRLAVLLAGWCGLRKGEILGLQVEDLDVEGRALRVERQLQWIGGIGERRPKYNSVRTVPLPEIVLAPLADHAEGMRAGWLMRRRGSGVPPKWSGRRAMLTVDLAAATESAQLDPSPTLRTLRATACSCWIRSGMPAAVADALLGHRPRGMGQVGAEHYWGGADLAQMDRAWLG